MSSLVRLLVVVYGLTTAGIASAGVHEHLPDALNPMRPFPLQQLANLSHR